MSKQSSEYLQKLIRVLNNLDLKKIEQLKQKIQSMINTGETFFVCGNGGSAATASHMACDLGKTILGKKPRDNKKRLRVISLNDNIPLLTAWGNDEGYQYVFSEVLKNLAKKDDFLLVITGSGNSANILEAVKEAKTIGIETFGLLGFDGGKAKNMLDNYLLVESDDYGLVEDAHAIINHLLTDYFKKLH